MARMAPTRGNLVKLQKSLRQATSGHDLLEQKRQVLMLELVRHIDSARDLQRDVIKTFGDAYGALQKANISLGIDTVEDIAGSVPITDEIVVRLRSVMGVEIPDIDEVDASVKPSYSYLTSTGAMDDAYLSFRKVLSTLVKLAEVETSVYRLAVQIRRTHRRVNALEKVVIPANRRESAFIEGTLEEGEREDFVRMKIAKANRGKRALGESGAGAV
ncbi:MAG: V-type ATP synthase subunit D [Synergistaceae bacterium]|nr:V-type ATP synthase subunit D [Synergistaceae bacterium]